MELRLKKIKDFILKKVEEIEVNTDFLKGLDSYLLRLIDTSESLIGAKTEHQVKADRQLLCSIGIDLKSESVPVSHYLKIFKSIDLANQNISARLLFRQIIEDSKGKLQFMETKKSINKKFTVLVFPLKERRYYIDPEIVGLTGELQEKLSIENIIDHYKKNESVPIYSNELYKGSPLRFFWLTTEQDLNSCGGISLALTQNIVDRLGLSHFDIEEVWCQHYFYVTLPNIDLETFKPNATIIDWTSSKTGFLSFHDDESGRTFSVTGYINYKVGLKERVFNRLNLTNLQRQGTMVTQLQWPVIPPLVINSDHIIQEAITRFNP